MVSFEPILPDGNLEQPRQILQPDWPKNTWERLVLVSLGRKNDFPKPVILSPVELCLRRGWMMVVKMTTLVGGDSDDDDMNDVGEDTDDGDDDNSVWWMIVVMIQMMTMVMTMVVIQMMTIVMIMAMICI